MTTGFHTDPSTIRVGDHLYLGWPIPAEAV